MPLDYRYDPRIHHVFDQSDPQGTLYDNWSPFLFVDTSAEDVSSITVNLNIKISGCLGPV